MVALLLLSLNSSCSIQQQEWSWKIRSDHTSPLLHTCRNFPVCFKLNSKSPVWPTWPCFLLLLHPLFYSPSYSNVPWNHISLLAVCPSYQYHSLFRAFTLIPVEKMFPSTQFFRQLSSCHSSLHSNVIVLGNLSLTTLHSCDHF